MSIESDDAIAELRARIETLLKNVGDAGRCRGCQAPIYWVTHKRNLKPTPYTPEGLNHFIDCPAASQFRRKKKADADPSA